MLGGFVWDGIGWVCPAGSLSSLAFVDLKFGEEGGGWGLRFCPEVPFSLLLSVCCLGILGGVGVGTGSGGWIGGVRWEVAALFFLPFSSSLSRRSPLFVLAF